MMLGLSLSVPIACWRKGQAREYLETERLPPPSTCYGFLLALVGEEERERHIGVRVTTGIVAEGETSVVLRTLWRVKDKKAPPGTSKNLRPDFQELTSNSMLRIWLDSSDEQKPGTLEERVANALAFPERLSRFGGLSIGESTHLINDLNLLTREPDRAATFVIANEGQLSLPVWVDHVGSEGTRHVVGNLVELSQPEPKQLPLIAPIAH